MNVPFNFAHEFNHVCFAELYLILREVAEIQGFSLTVVEVLDSAHFYEVGLDFVKRLVQDGVQDV